MDVERVQSFSPGGGPGTIEISQRAMASYADLLESRGFKATFFIVPNAAVDHPGVVQDLRRRGHECGMHFHANSFETNYKIKGIKSIGCQAIDQQREWLSTGKEMFEHSVDFEPQCFRGGFFSANQDTYQVLIELGITSGSTSLPGRYWKARHSLWRKVPCWIHVMKAEDHPGFIEVPVTSHVNLLGLLTPHGDVRFENEPSVARVFHAVKQCLLVQQKANAHVYHVCFLTHNSFDYGTGTFLSMPNKRGVVEAILDNLPTALDHLGFELVPATVPEAAARFRESNA